MKKLTLLLFCLLAFDCYSQIPGKKIPGPITLFDTLKVSVGDTLHMGQGSNANKNFIYFFTDQQYTAPNGYANTEIIIRGIKVIENSKSGNKYYALVKPQGLFNWGVDLINAIKYHEVIGLNNKRFQEKTSSVAVVIQNKLSVADELTKLKKLLDEGVLTKAEFDSQKKKLLGQ